MYRHVKGISSTFIPSSIQGDIYNGVVGKTKVGIWLDSSIAERLDAMADTFDGLKGDLVAAALQMFLESNGAAQKAALKEVMQAKVDRLFDKTEKKSRLVAEVKTKPGRQ